MLKYIYHAKKEKKMLDPNVYFEIPDLLKYNHTVRKSPSGEAFTGHSHNLYEMLYVIKGDASYVIEGKKYKLKSGDLIITRPRKYHFIQIDSAEDYERHNIIFDRKELGINTKILPDGLDVINVKRESIIDGIFKKLDYYAENFGEREFTAVAALLVQEIIYNLSLIEEKADSISSEISPLLSRAIAYIDKNLFKIRSISEISDALFVADSYLFRLFKKELFQTPKKYITEKRLLYAQNQIKKGKRPTEVSVECGFDDYTTFYRNYSAHFGRAPSSENVGK